MTITCYMCNAVATSLEHAPPLCLFPDKESFGSDLRKNLITVPSCDQHNSIKSEDDEFLRTTLCLPSAGLSAAATHQFYGKTLRGAKRSPNKYTTYVNCADAIVPHGKAVFTTDRVRFDRCVEYIAKAIYFHTYGCKWLLNFTVSSPHILAKSLDGNITADESLLQAMQITRAFLSTEPILGNNSEVFKYRIKIEGGMLAFAALFYESFEVFAVSFPTIADISTR